jgi:tRNA (cytosine38-C5)-methyltransferase
MSADAPPAAKRGRTEEPAANLPAAVRALEFYCGVGGLHYSLQRARPDGDARVVGAFDINPNACDVYEHNFGTRPIANSLYAVPAARLDKFNSNLWLMSPPCQPFTRQGSQRDKADARAESFLRMLDLLPSLRNKPSHLLVENVVGFETSETRETMLETLCANGFEFREFI